MDMSEIARYLEETQYKDEIDALSGAFNKLAFMQQMPDGTMAAATQGTQGLSRFVKRAPEGGRWNRTSLVGRRR